MRHAKAIESVFPVFADVSFLFVSVVLEPNLDLCRCEAYHSRQVFAFRRGEISLLAKSAFQFERLCFCEEHASFSFFLFRLLRLLSLDFRTRQRQF